MVSKSCYVSLKFNWTLVIYLHTVKCQTFPFRKIQFNIRTLFSFIWPIDRTLSGATTPR